MKNNCSSNVEVWRLELFLEVPIKLHFLWAIQHWLPEFGLGLVAWRVPCPAELRSIISPQGQGMGVVCIYNPSSLRVESRQTWWQTVCVNLTKLTGQLTSPSDACIPGLITCQAQNSVAKMGSLYDKYCKLYLTVDTMHQRP